MSQFFQRVLNYLANEVIVKSVCQAGQSLIKNNVFVVS